MKNAILILFVLLAFVSNAQIPHPDENTPSTGTKNTPSTGTVKIKSTPSTGAKNTPSTGTVKIKSTPSNCKVFYSGKEIGQTTYAFKKTAGNYSLTIKADGYKSQEIKVKVQKGKTSEISVSLEKEMTLLDSLLFLSKEMSQFERMTDESNMSEEEKNIHSFIKQSSEYAKSIESLYTMSVEPLDSTLSVQKQKQKFSLLILKSQSIITQEKPVMTSALMMMTNLKSTDSHVELGVDEEQLTDLLHLIEDTSCAPIPKEVLKDVLSLLGDNKLNEAHGIYKNRLLQEKVERRYFVFLSVLKNFRTVGELRLNELLSKN